MKQTDIEGSDFVVISTTERSSASGRIATAGDPLVWCYCWRGKVLLSEKNAGTLCDECASERGEA